MVALQADYMRVPPLMFCVICRTGNYVQLPFGRTRYWLMGPEDGTKVYEPHGMLFVVSDFVVARASPRAVHS